MARPEPRTARAAAHPAATPRPRAAARRAEPARSPSAWTLIALAIIGLGLSAYLTTLHYEGVVPFCTQGGPVNCGRVLTSSSSLVPGTPIPVTVPGMLWFLVSAALAAVSLRRGRRRVAEPPWLRPAHTGWAVLGLIAVFYLVHAEVTLRSLCEWCTAVHVVILLSLLVTLARLRREPANSR